MRPTIAAIVAAAAGAYDLDEKDIMGPSRQRMVSWTRRVAVVVALDLGYPKKHIASVLNKDHSTITYCHDVVVQAEGREAEAYKEAIRRVKRALSDG